MPSPPPSPEAAERTARPAPAGPVGTHRTRGGRGAGELTRWCVRLHRWAALTLGLLLLLEATSGAVLLYANDITRALHPQRYVSTPSADPLTQLEALRMVQATHPELGAVGVQNYEGIYLVRGPAKSRESTDAFVDPGTGRINGIGAEQPGFARFLINIHDCALTCDGLPGYQPWLTTRLPGLFGKDATVGHYLLGAVGVLLVVLAGSGAIAWWPGARNLLVGFVIRLRRGNYVRDLDLHRVVGIVAVPFLLMWGLTGAAVYYQWPATAYFALLPGHQQSPPQTPSSGTGPMLSIEAARSAALARHPGARVEGISASTPAEPGGTYGFRLSQGFDPYQHWNYSGNLYVEVDSHGGGVSDYNDDTGGPLTQQLWNNGIYYGLHFGTLVPALPRILWLGLGLTPALLGVTGVTIWLTKRRGRRTRRQRRATAHRQVQT